MKEWTKLENSNFPIDKRDTNKKILIYWMLSTFLLFPKEDTSSTLCVAIGAWRCCFLLLQCNALNPDLSVDWFWPFLNYSMRIIDLNYWTISEFRQSWLSKLLTIMTCNCEFVPPKHIQLMMVPLSLFCSCVLILISIWRTPMTTITGILSTLMLFH